MLICIVSLLRVAETLLHEAALLDVLAMGIVGMRCPWADGHNLLSLGRTECSNDHQNGCVQIVRQIQRGKTELLRLSLIAASTSRVATQD